MPFHELLGELDLVLFEEAVADFVAQRATEGVCHAAADDERVALVDEALDDADLVGNLGAAENRDKGTGGVFNRAAEEFELLFDEETADCDGCKAVLHDARGSRVRAVSGAECVVHIDVAKVRELPAKLLAVLFFARVKTGVFEQNALAVTECGDLCVRVLAHEVGCKSDFPGEDLRKTVGNGLERELLGVVLERLCDVFLLCLLLFVRRKSLNRLLFLLGETEAGGEDVVRLSEVGAEDNLCAVVHEVLDGGKRTVDAVLVGDDAVNHGDIEVNAGQTLLALDIDVLNCHFAHIFLLLEWIFVCGRIHAEPAAGSIIPHARAHSNKNRAVTELKAAKAHNPRRKSAKATDDGRVGEGVNPSDKI